MAGLNDNFTPHGKDGKKVIVPKDHLIGKQIDACILNNNGVTREEVAELDFEEDGTMLVLLRSKMEDVRASIAEQYDKSKPRRDLRDLRNLFCSAEILQPKSAQAMWDQPVHVTLGVVVAYLGHVGDRVIDDTYFTNLQ